ncbi:MAG TPA: DUF2306 domain-containing protein [Rhizomicrobium sp.]|nr:DUF2306 domain-containing protein [Rhizomicrobium sp.]
MTPLVIFHVVAGTIALFSGAVALFVRKGAQMHRVFGTVFFVSMLIMAATASYLAVTVPGQGSNLPGGIFTFYLVATAWATVRRKAGTIGVFEIAAILVPLGIVAALAMFIVQGPKALPNGVPMAALYIVSSIALIAAAGDLNVILRRGIAGTARIARHLWRMCVALIFATGSGFTNGLPRLLPSPMHVTPVFFLPMLVPLVLMVFWLIRVRLTSWYKSDAVAI